MLAAGNSPSIAKQPMSEHCRLHAGMKHVEPEMDAGDPSLRLGQVGSLTTTGLTFPRNALLLPPPCGAGTSGGSQGAAQ